MILDEDFLKKVKGPILSVWDYIACDLGESCQESGDRLTNEIALESCIDADRLTSNGNKEADEVIREAIKAHTYKKVMGFLKKNIKLV